MNNSELVAYRAKLTADYKQRFGQDARLSSLERVRNDVAAVQNLEQALSTPLPAASDDTAAKLATATAENATLKATNGTQAAEVTRLTALVADLQGKLTADSMASGLTAANALASQHAATIGNLRTELVEAKRVTAQKINAEATRVLAGSGHPILNIGVDNSTGGEGGGTAKATGTGRTRLIAATKSQLEKLNS